MQVLPAEEAMWSAESRATASRLSDAEISEKYTRGEGRIVLENNREKLRGFVEQLDRHEFMDLRPFYQRRPRWDVKRQSRLIESFIINVPVPPVFLYERDFNTFEVMDGQQRITAIRDFYKDRFPLTGLVQWPELNGRYYHNLPSTVQAGIDRRSISSIVMLKESAALDEEALLLRQLVFERLNTGGIALKRQEIRNALYQGPLNDLLLELSRHSVLRAAWGLPEYHPDEIAHGSKSLLKKSFFSEMEDVELVLRFFALRNAEKYRGGMQGFLDLYMMKAATLSADDLGLLQQIFNRTIEVAGAIYGKNLFRPFNVKDDKWATGPHKAVFDAVMVAISQNLEIGDRLVAHKEHTNLLTRNLFINNPKGTFTGQGNTKSDVLNRIDLFSKMLQAAAG